jgi:hypothetical protein
MTEYKPFDSAEEFKNALGALAPSYEEFTPFKDMKAGFSVKRKYPPNLRFVPAKTRSGEDDSVALIKLSYLHPIDNDNQFDPKRVPLQISVSVFSRWMVNHWGFNFNDDHCPTKESLELSKASMQPLELRSDNAFFFDHSSGKIISREGKQFTGTDFLDLIFEHHIKSVRWLAGDWVQTKKRFYSRFARLFNALVVMGTWLLKIVFSREFEPSKNFAETYTKGYGLDQFKRRKVQTFNFFNYKAPIPILLIFCVVMIASYVYSVLNEKTKLIAVFNNSAVIILFAFPAIWVLDWVLPHLLLYLLNIAIRIRTNLEIKSG